MMLQTPTLIFSDLHGDCQGARLLAQVITQQNPRQIISLGDNLWPENSPVAQELLQQWSKLLVVVAGNCDEALPLEAIGLPSAPESAQLTLPQGGGIFLSHGHCWNPHRPPPTGCGEIMLFGHTHIPMADKVLDGLVAFNPGSAGKPRGGWPRSCGWFDGQCFTVHRLDDWEELLRVECPQQK